MCILLSERIQSEKVAHCMHVHLFTVCVHLYDNLEKAKLYRKLKKKKKQWFLGIVVGRGINRQSKEDFFRTVKNILYDTT